MADVAGVPEILGAAACANVAKTEATASSAKAQALGVRGACALCMYSPPEAKQESESEVPRERGSFALEEEWQCPAPCPRTTQPLNRNIRQQSLRVRDSITASIPGVRGGVEREEVAYLKCLASQTYSKCDTAWPSLTRLCEVTKTRGFFSSGAGVAERTSCRFRERAFSCTLGVNAVSDGDFGPG